MTTLFNGVLRNFKKLNNINAKFVFSLCTSLKVNVINVIKLCKLFSESF